MCLEPADNALCTDIVAVVLGLELCNLGAQGERLGRRVRVIICVGWRNVLGFHLR